MNWVGVYFAQFNINNLPLGFFTDLFYFLFYPYAPNLLLVSKCSFVQRNLRAYLSNLRF